MRNTLLSKNAFRSLFWCFALLVMNAQASWGQLLTEDFNYSLATVLTTTSTADPTTGWLAHSGNGTQNVDVTNGLSFTGFAGSGIGGAANLDNTGQDINKTFTSQTTGTVYASMMIQTQSTNSAGYFFMLAPTPTSTIFSSRVWINGTGSGVGVGGSTAPTYTAITAGTTVFLVVKYDFTTKVTSLFVLNTFSTTEPGTANQTFTEIGTTTTIGAVALRQYNAAQKIIVDGIRVGTTWASVTPAVTTWNGSAWSNSTPDINTEAIIAGTYSTTTNGVFSAKKVTVNSGSLTINSGTNVTIQNELINTLTATDVVVENNANLIQVNAIANTGNITVKRNSASLMRQDYTLWSSPVVGQQLQAFSPATLAARFYTYDSSLNVYAAVSAPASTNFATGTGYLIRMPNDHPITPTIWNGTFTGIPNNGTVAIPVTLGTYNAIGNPYPSAIDADLFIAANPLEISEALYFWRKTNNAATTSYATYTLAGGTGTNPNPGDPLGLVPNGIIQVGQGFITKSTTTTLSFTNTMKVADNANQFLRTSTVERNRIWLNLTNTAGLFSQTMVAYMTNATSGIDGAIDGHIFNDSQTALTSIINTEEFAIQGRALPFVTSDVVALGFKSELAGAYTIAIDHVDGLFTGGQAIYLKDNLTNTTHNLSTGSYAFATAAGVFNTRFEIVYQNLLNVNLPTFDENSVVVYKNNGAILINTGAVTMDNVKIFDISGRLLTEKSNVNTSEITVDSSKFASQVLIVQITSDSQIIVSKKVVN